MWSSRWSSSLSSSCAEYMDWALRCMGAEAGGPGKYFDLTNAEGEPLPIAWIGLSNPFVGVDILMFWTPLEVSIAPDGKDRVMPLRFHDSLFYSEADGEEEGESLFPLSWYFFGLKFNARRAEMT